MPNGAAGTENDISAPTEIDSGDVYIRGFLFDNVLHSEGNGDIHFGLYIPESYDGSEPYALYVTLPGYEGLYFQGVGINIRAEDYGIEAQKYNERKIIVALLVVVAILLAVIVILLAIDLQNPGFTITFDSKGGTDVAPQNQMYGELLEVPEDPTREGYEFTGWYTDYACDVLWLEDSDTIQSDLTLYAGWESTD